MKIKVTYLPEESEEAAEDMALLRLRHPGAKLRASDAHPPHQLCYLQVKSGNSQRLSPCDLCRHNPPSSMDGKPCSLCPAEGVLRLPDADDKISAK